VVQYLPGTLGDLLAGWQRLPRRIVINTAAIHTQHEFFTVNSLGTAFCPYRVQTQASLIRGLTRLGYRLREARTHPVKVMHIPFHPEPSLDHYSGYCLDLNRN
jgi:putative methyltransferase (TIGR04325 family)